MGRSLKRSSWLGRSSVINECERYEMPTKTASSGAFNAGEPVRDDRNQRRGGVFVRKRHQKPLPVARNIIAVRTVSTGNSYLIHIIVSTL